MNKAEAEAATLALHMAMTEEFAPDSRVPGPGHVFSIFVLASPVTRQGCAFFRFPLLVLDRFRILLLCFAYHPPGSTCAWGPW